MLKYTNVIYRLLPIIAIILISSVLSYNFGLRNRGSFAEEIANRWFGFFGNTMPFEISPVDLRNSKNSSSSIRNFMEEAATGGFVFLELGGFPEHCTDRTEVSMQKESYFGLEILYMLVILDSQCDLVSIHLSKFNKISL